MAPFESTRGSVAAENSRSRRATPATQVPATQVPATQLDPMLEERQTGLAHRTQEERSAKFALEQRKLEADPAAIELRTSSDKAAAEARSAAEAAASEARTARGNEESQARIATIRSGPAVAAAAVAPTTANGEDMTDDLQAYQNAPNPQRDEEFW